MATTLLSPLAERTKEIIYPETDGEPMAENTEQFDWIVLIKLGLEAVFAERSDVFIAGDLFWYPVEGNPNIRYAPDVLVAFGRPKGRRGSYLQWKEEAIAPQVVFEILSPGNRFGEMLKKLRFYEKYGVEEYYLYDPDKNELSGWFRKGEALESVEEAHGWTSPRLGIRFELDQETMHLYRPDGQKFIPYVEAMQATQQADARADQADARADQADARADQASNRADRADARAETLASRLREMGIDPSTL